MGLVLFPGDADNSSPDVSWSYSGFAAFRRRLAETEGFVLSEMSGFGGERPWRDVSTALEPLLDHPDDGGDDLSPVECASILVRLEAITNRRAAEGGDQLLQQHIEDARQLAGVLRLCIDKDVPLAFLRSPPTMEPLTRLPNVDVKPLPRRKVKGCSTCCHGSLPKER
ncbi:hypothetical protein [Streptomyces agglomeratus]|uniref:hypothetical protein n=1 Tax=Streptomyces agglomeratus TaxID=285458 RepID=UPI0026942D31